MEGIKHKVISDVQGEITKKNAIQNNILETLKSFELKIEKLSNDIKTLNELVLLLNTKMGEMNESFIIL